MSLPGLIILIMYGIFGVLFFGVLFSVKKDGRELFGRPTMNVIVQMTGKFALFVPVLILPAAALGKQLFMHQPAIWMVWMAVLISLIAMVYLSLSILQMGKFTKMGLPNKDEIQLQTTGIYAISRNPMYFGLFLLALASNLYAPSLLNVITAIIGIYVHHFIILQEERYLEENFSAQWLEYRLKVRRYL
jgi:protein-S-isoprenylcysteine O-methyltransferase Ste14